MRGGGEPKAKAFDFLSVSVPSIQKLGWVQMLIAPRLWNVKALLYIHASSLRQTFTKHE